MDRQVGKNLAAFRHQADAQPGDGIAGQPVDVGPVKDDPARANRCQAHDGSHRGAFAHAVSAQQGDHFAFADLQADAEQGLAFSVKGLNRFYVEHPFVSSPRYASRTAGFTRISSGVPLAMACP